MRALIITLLLTLSGEQLLAYPKVISRTGTGWPFEKIKFDRPIQSPINILTSEAEIMKLPNLEFYKLSWKNVTVRVENTGYTVELSIPDLSVEAPYIRGGPLDADYQLNNIHLHWGLENFDGAEHQINNHRYAIEGHAVHFNKKYGTFEHAKEEEDGLAVIAFFGKVGKQDNPDFKVMTDQIPSIINAGSFVDVSADLCLKWFVNIGQCKFYYTYPGSLTTPPYSENVIWIVYPKPVNISTDQVDSFRRLLSDDMEHIRSNRRDIQPFNDRPLIFAI